MTTNWDRRREKNEEEGRKNEEKGRKIEEKGRKNEEKGRKNEVSVTGSLDTHGHDWH